MTAFLKRYSLAKPVGAHQEDVQKQAHVALASSLSMAVATGKARSVDLELASRVAAGGLRPDSLVEALTATFLTQYQAGMGTPAMPPASSKTTLSAS